MVQEEQEDLVDPRQCLQALMSLMKEVHLALADEVVISNGLVVNDLLMAPVALVVPVVDLDEEHPEVVVEEVHHLLETTSQDHWDHQVLLVESEIPLLVQ